MLHYLTLKFWMDKYPKYFRYPIFQYQNIHISLICCFQILTSQYPIGSQKYLEPQAQLIKGWHFHHYYAVQENVKCIVSPKKKIDPKCPSC